MLICPRLTDSEPTAGVWRGKLAFACDLLALWVDTVLGRITHAKRRADAESAGIRHPRLR